MGSNIFRIGAYLSVVAGSTAPDWASWSILAGKDPGNWVAVLHSPTALLICLGILTASGLGLHSAMALRKAQ